MNNLNYFYKIIWILTRKLQNMVTFRRISVITLFCFRITENPLKSLNFRFDILTYRIFVKKSHKICDILSIKKFPVIGNHWMSRRHLARTQPRHTLGRQRLPSFLQTWNSKTIKSSWTSSILIPSEIHNIFNLPLNYPPDTQSLKLRPLRWEK